jgi:hypothetical protein
MQRAVEYEDNNCHKAQQRMIPYSIEQKCLMGEIAILYQIRLRHVLEGKKN